VDGYLVDFIRILEHGIPHQIMPTFVKACQNQVFMAQSNHMLSNSNYNFVFHTQFVIINSADCFTKDSLLFSS
jgi:hypothetical protein